MKLTPLMREALEKALREDGLRRTHSPGPGQPPWPAPANTLHALTRHELVDHNRRRNRHGWPMDVWSINDKGRQALKPIRLVKDPSRSMHAMGHAQHRIMIGGVWRDISAPEPEKVLPWHDGSSRPARIRHEEAQPAGRRRAA